jgi:general secretion pathway protein D
MNRARLGCLAASLIAVFLLAGMRVHAQSPTASASSRGGMQLSELVVMVAKKSGKKFVLDPRAQGEVFIGPDPARFSYDDLLSVLRVHELVALDRDDTIFVLKDDKTRTLPVPLVSGNEKHPDAEVVTRIIHVRNTSAPLLVPILRSLIPQFGHLAAHGCTNDLILVDYFANVKRIESIIQALDKGEAFKPEVCSPSPRKAGGEG